MSRVARHLLAVSLLGGSIVIGLQTGGAAAGDAGDAVTQVKAVQRVHLENGQDVVADRRQISVSVSRTRNLLDRQRVLVSWKGAIPTGGITPDQRASEAAQEEHPMVVLECRGVDDASASPAQRLAPETCWTQTSTERFATSPCCSAQGSRFPVWRMDRFATPDQRHFVSGAPSPLPASCAQAEQGYPERWLAMRGADGKVYPGGYGGCAGQAPEATIADADLALPGNAIYGVTNADGSGQATVDVRTAQSNATLGCSESVVCSLVVVPIEGISCDGQSVGVPASDRPSTNAEAVAARSACERAAALPPGGRLTGASSEVAPAVTGAFWWSASNWRNHIAFPLTFVPLPRSCAVTGGKEPVDIYGSELLAPVTQQWQTRFCLDPALTPFRHIQTGEPQARNLLRSGSVEAALTTFGPTSPIPGVVTAPVAVGGFALGFVIDGDDGEQLHHLKLNARLLAKLLTESYPATPDVRNNYEVATGSGKSQALRGNPMTLEQDPEFRALNPDAPSKSLLASGLSTMAFLAPQSDVTRALTSYINADPDARAFLDGKPDPDGMKVNPLYAGIELPVDTWPLLDTFVPPYSSEYNPCLAGSSVPYLPLVAAPVQRLATVSQHLEYDYSGSNTTCKVIDQGVYRLKADGREPSGRRFLIGVTTLADAQRYGIDVAALQTGRSKSFVLPTTETLSAGAKELRQSSGDPGIWSLDYSAVAGSDAAAYPGVMPVHLQVNSTAPKADVQRYARFLRYASQEGQVPGDTAGLLPRGFLPLGSGSTAGLAARARAAADLLAPVGNKPTGSGGAAGPRRGAGGHGGGSNGSASASTNPSSGALGSTGAAANAAGQTPPGRLPGTSSTGSAASPAPSPRAGTAPAVAIGLIGETAAMSIGAWGAIVPVLLLGGILAALVFTTSGRRRA